MRSDWATGRDKKPLALLQRSERESARTSIMASERDKCADLSQDDPTTCRLAALRKRSQIDFEIEFFERILSRDPNYVEVLMNLGDLFTRKGCHRRALQADLRLARLRPTNAEVFYNLACSYALLNHKSEAIASLRRAVRLGFTGFDPCLSAPVLEWVQRHPGFRGLFAHWAGRPGTQHFL